MGIFLFGIFRTFLTMFTLFQSFLYMLNKWTLTCTSLFCVFFFVFLLLMISYFCMPVILVLAELFGPHTLSVKQHLNLDIDHNNGT